MKLKYFLLPAYLMIAFFCFAGFANADCKKIVPVANMNNAANQTAGSCMFSDGVMVTAIANINDNSSAQVIAGVGSNSKTGAINFEYSLPSGVTTNAGAPTDGQTYPPGVYELDFMSWAPNQYFENGGTAKASITNTTSSNQTITLKIMSDGYVGNKWVETLKESVNLVLSPTTTTGTIHSGKVTGITITGGESGQPIVSMGNMVSMIETVIPPTAANQKVTWSVTNGTGSAIIDPTIGVLTPKTLGTVTVTATAQDGSGVSGSEQITIVPTRVTDITVTGANSATAIPLDSTLQMNAAISPSNAANQKVTWSVANETGSATISSTGILTPTTAGTVTVTATAQDGTGVSGSEQITSSYHTVTVSTPNFIYTIPIDSTLQMNAAVSPSNISNQKVTWSVANGTGSATIDPATGLLTPTTAGTVTVTATAQDGTGVSGSAPITITPGISTSNKVSSVEAGQTLQMVNGGMGNNIIWEVINITGIATINQTTGLLTAKSAGIVQVNVLGGNGGQQGLTTITITGKCDSAACSSDSLCELGNCVLQSAPQSVYISPICPAGYSGCGYKNCCSPSQRCLYPTNLFNSICVPAQASQLTTINILTPTTVILNDGLIKRLYVQALDQNGSVITAPALIWSVSNGTGSATIDPATGILTPTAAGTVTVTATAQDGSGVTGTQQITLAEATGVIPCTYLNWLESTSDCKGGTQTETWTKIGTCTGGETQPAPKTFACTPPVKTITLYCSSVSPDNIVVGNTQSCYATDNNSFWVPGTCTSDSPSVIVTPGGGIQGHGGCTITAMSAGTANITMQYNGITSNTVPVNISSCDAGTTACGSNCCASYQTCKNGKCVQCAAGTMTCGSDCCTSTQACQNGKCVTSKCTSGTTPCGYACCSSNQYCFHNSGCDTKPTCSAKGRFYCTSTLGYLWNCCDSTQTCNIATGVCVSPCLGAGQTACGGLCCSSSQSCHNNKCAFDPSLIASIKFLGPDGVPRDSLFYYSQDFAQLIHVQILDKSGNPVVANIPITFTSSNPKVASIVEIKSASGAVLGDEFQPLTPGTTTLTATIGSVSGSLNLTLQKFITLIQPTEPLYVGGPALDFPSITQYNSSPLGGGSVKYSSSNSSVMNGGYPVGVGTATITVVYVPYGHCLVGQGGCQASPSYFDSITVTVLSSPDWTDKSTITPPQDPTAPISLKGDCSNLIPNTDVNAPGASCWVPCGGVMSQATPVYAQGGGTTYSSFNYSCLVYFVARLLPASNGSANSSHVNVTAATYYAATNANPPAGFGQGASLNFVLPDGVTKDFQPISGGNYRIPINSRESGASQWGDVLLTSVDLTEADNSLKTISFSIDDGGATNLRASANVILNSPSAKPNTVSNSILNPPPYGISITQPATATILATGSQTYIKWTVWNPNSKVNISLTNTSNGATTTIAKNTGLYGTDFLSSTLGSYLWNINATPGKYTITITDTNNPDVSGTSPEFTITSTICNSFTYGLWSACSSGIQSRTVVSSSPSGCGGGNPVTWQFCTPVNTNTTPTTCSLTPNVDTTTPGASCLIDCSGQFTAKISNKYTYAQVYANPNVFQFNYDTDNIKCFVFVSAKLLPSSNGSLSGSVANVSALINVTDTGGASSVSEFYQAMDNEKFNLNFLPSFATETSLPSSVSKANSGSTYSTNLGYIVTNLSNSKQTISFQLVNTLPSPPPPLTLNNYNITYPPLAANPIISNPIPINLALNLQSVTAVNQVTSITVAGAASTTTVSLGNMLQMSAAVLPANATNKNVTWSVANGTGSATIDPSTGILSPMAAGTVTVTATAQDGSGIVGTEQITVTGINNKVTTLIKVTSITVTSAGSATSVSVGQTLQMNTIVLPSDATDQSTTWFVINGTGKATINHTTGLLTAVNAGTVNVIALANDGTNIHGIKKITVTP